MKNPSTAIVWFREDLRLEDNPALASVSSHYDQVIPLYLHLTNDTDKWSAGAASQWWLHHSLIDLDHSLRQLGARLVIRQGPDLLAMLLDLIQQRYNAVNQSSAADVLLCARRMVASRQAYTVVLHITRTDF